MSQTGSKNYTSVRQDIACVEEQTVLLPCIANAGVATNVITFAASALSNMGITTNMLSGQEIWVLGGTLDYARTTNLHNAGAILHVASNTANTITCEETLTGTGKCDQLHTNLTGTATVTTSDRLCVTTRGIIPGIIQQKWLLTNGTVDPATVPASQVFMDNVVDTMFGVIDSSTLPDPVLDLEEKYAHSSATQPGRHTYVYNRTSYETSWPLSTIWGKYLYDSFGWVADKARDPLDVTATSGLAAAPGNLAPTYDIYPGEMVVTVSDKTLYIPGQFVEIADTTTRANGEIRMIVAIYEGGAVDSLTLDKPLRRFHAVINTSLNMIHADCTERAYSTAKGVTHTIYKFPSIPFHTIRNKKKGVFDDITQNDLNFFYTGHVFPEVTLSSTTDKELNMDLKSTGLGAKANPQYWNPNKGGGAGYDTFVPPSLSRTYYYDSSAVALKPIHFSRSYMTIDGARWHQAADIELTLTRVSETQYAHTFMESSAGVAGDGLVGGNDPININTGRVGMKFNFTMPLHNKTLWDLVKAKATIGTAVWVFEMLRSSVFTEAWTITATEIPVTEAKLQLPSEAVESQNILGPPKDVYITVFDKTPYY